MTAPADVWAIQRPDGSFFGDNGEGFVSLWRDEHGARVACIGSEGNRPVRFRLVRVDEPEQPTVSDCLTVRPAEQPQRDEVGELRECVRELARILWIDVAMEPEARCRAMNVANRLAAQSGPAGEVGDG